MSLCAVIAHQRSWPQRALAHPWKRSILPLHDICGALGDELTRCLPALHGLTGCDITSKISTKLCSPESCPQASLLNFECPQLTESAIQMAETFLVKYLKPFNRPGDILMTCISLHSIAIPSDGERTLAPQLTQGNRSRSL